MPTLNRPNAPERLPSGAIEGVSFRPWRARGAHPSVSPPLATDFPSPISPTTVASPRKPSKQGHRRLQSEGSARLSLYQEGVSAKEGISTTTALELIAPATAQDGNSPFSRHASSGSLESGTTSSHSSMSSKARKLFTIPNLRISSNATKDGAPPRAPRKGYGWKHEISGHWLEIRIGRTRRSEGNTRSDSGSNTSTPLAKSETSVTDKTPMTQSLEVSVGSASPQTTPRIKFEDAPSPRVSPQEGLYCRAKRRLGLKRSASNSSSSTEGLSWTKTGEVLERTASMLRLISMRHSPTSASTSSSALSNPSIAAPKRQRFRSRHKRGDSSSSSVRSLLMGKAPVSTPEPREMYTGSDNKQYFNVELTDPGAPTFLPSEARRINTPPAGKHKPRGFFFDYTAPPSVDLTPFPERNATSPTSDDSRIMSDRQRRISETEWYRAKLDAIEAETLAREQFALQVPDHLPNSPLCPKHPKHKSGGTGVCPLHGRNFPSGEKSTPLVSPGSFFADGSPHKLEY